MSASIRCASIACVLVVVAPLAAHAETAFDRANAAYADQRWDDAARELEGIIQEHGYAPEVLERLGDAYRGEGETGLAILAYERARLLAARDPVIAERLRALRSEAGLATPAESTIEALAALFPAREWLFAGAIALSAFCLSALLAGALRRARWMGMTLALPSFAIVAACGAALFVGTLGGRAVVVAGEAKVRVAPIAEADEVLTLRSGELVRIEGSHGGQLRVSTPDGSRGWIPRDAIEPVVPGALP